MVRFRGAWLLLLLAAPFVSAQALDPDVQVAAAAPGYVDVPWNGTATAHWEVTNAGPLAVDVSVAVDGAWNTEILRGSAFSLNAGQSNVVSVRLWPTDPDVPGGAGPDLVLTATATDAAGRTDEASAPVETQVTARPVPVVVPTPADTTTRDASIAAGAVLLPLLVAYGVVGLLYAVHVPKEPIRVLGVHGAWVHVRVRNRAPWAQTVLLGLQRPREGWQVAGDTDRVTVPARGEETYTVFVRRLGDIDDPERCRILVRSRRSTLYPWRKHGAITVDSEPIDLRAWSAKKIQDALEEAAVPQAPA